MTGWARRNWGCRVGGCSIEGMRALILENRVVRAVILADKGADVIELVHKPTDTDVMWRAPAGVVNPAAGVATSAAPAGAFMDCYGGGWQELFPTLGSPAAYYGAPMGEHGEVAMLPWDVVVGHDDPEMVSVTFSVRCRRSPFRLSRTMTLAGSASPTLAVKEEVVSEAGEILQFMWGHHPVIGAPFLEPGCTIDLPGGQVQAVAERNGKFLSSGEPTTWPEYRTADGRRYDLSVVGPSSPEQIDELYVSALPEGRYEVRNPRLGVSFELVWDIQTFPYLWWWRSLGQAGGYPWYSRTFMLGLEPFSSVPPEFGAALDSGTTLALGPGESRSTRLAATLRYLNVDETPGQ